MSKYFMPTQVSIGPLFLRPLGLNNLAWTVEQPHPLLHNPFVVTKMELNL